jgi:hypothetical protein
MAVFHPNPARFPPYKSFKFRIRRDGRNVAAVGTMSALKRTGGAAERVDELKLVP